MDIAATFINRLVSITQFNKGQASKIFDRLKNEPELVVLKNNQATAIIVSVEEYSRLAEIEENYALLLEANKRLVTNEEKKNLSLSEVLSELGISENELDEVEVPEFV